MPVDKTLSNQALQAENEQLRQAMVQIQNVLAKRSESLMGEILDAINVTLHKARAGDQTAKENIDLLRGQLNDIQNLGSLAIVRKNLDS